MIITFIGFKITFSNMGPKTTPSLISKGGYQIPPPLGGREIDTPWEIGLKGSRVLSGSSEQVLISMMMKN